MSSILTWVKQIVIFYIFSNFIIHVLPSGNYQKYVKFFVGIILIAIVLNPLVGMFKLDTLFEDLYNSAVSSNSLNEMRVDLKYAEQSKFDAITEPYKEEIIKNVEKIVMDNHLYPVRSNVVFNMDSESESFGQIQAINLQVSKKYTSDSKIVIDKIKIEVENSESNSKKTNNLSVDSLNIQNSIAEFYNISPSNVNIIE